MQDLHSTSFNCAFARRAVHELSVVQNVDRETRQNKFQELFPYYKLSASYFESRFSVFDRHCKSIIEAWKKRWNPGSSRAAYEEAFSIAKWEALSQSQKERHTLAQCNECSTLFQELQQKFPMKPIHTVPSLVTIDNEALATMGTKDGTKMAKQHLNHTFKDTFNTSFTDTLIQHGDENLQVKLGFV